MNNNLTFLRAAPYKVTRSYPPPEEIENKVPTPKNKQTKQKNAKTESFIEVTNNLHGHFRGEVFQAVIHLFLRHPAKSRSQNDKPSDI